MATTLSKPPSTANSPSISHIPTEVVGCCAKAGNEHKQRETKMLNRSTKEVLGVTG
jgi:hypothetical protein